MRAVRVGTEACPAVLLVGLEVALEPRHLRVALEREHVRRDAVEEPAIVGDDHRAAGEAEQRLLERAERVDVEVVRRLVEQQQVAAGAQQLGQVQAVALAAGQLGDLLLLVGALEVDARDVLAAVHHAVADLELVEAVGDLLPDGLVVGERVARLVDVRELDRVADPQLARVGLLLAGDHAEERRLAGAVRADDADDAAARQLEAQVVDEQLVAEALAQVLGLDDDVAEPRPGGDVDLDLVELDVALLGDERLEVGQARLLLGLAALRVLAHPLELGGDRLLARLLGALLLGQAGLLLLEPARVVALVGDAARAVELEDPAGDVVEEVAVVGDRDHRALVLVEVALQPRDGLGVEVVGGLVEQQQVRGGEQQPAQRDAAALAAAQLRHVGVGRRQAQRVHRVLDVRVEAPRVGGVDLGLQRGELVGGLVGVVGGELVEAVEERTRSGDAVLDIGAHVLCLVEVRLLLKQAHRRVGREHRVAAVVGLAAGHDAQDRRLARAVVAEHADLRAGQERERDVLEHRLVGRERLGQAVHLEDVLMGHVTSEGSPSAAPDRRDGERLAPHDHSPATPVRLPPAPARRRRDTCGRVSELAIRLRGVVKRFGRITAVDGLDLDVPVGTCVGLLGPNGAGKSTTMRMLTAQAIADEGELHVLGYKLPRESKMARAACGVVPQLDNLDTTVSVEQNLLVFSHLYRIPRPERKAAIEDALDLARLADRRDTRVDKLSGGMRRRLLIARALVHKPRLVLMDEPTVGLDPQVRQELWALVDALRSQGTTILMSTHYIEEAQRLCDTVTIMSHGKAVAVGPPSELVLEHAGAQALEVYGPPGRLAEVEQQAAAAGYRTRRTGTSISILGVGAGTNGFSADGERRQTNLEDVFVLLTGEEIA